MIDFLESNNVLYAIVIGCTVAALSIGYMLGYQAPEIACVEYIVEAEEQRANALDLNKQLTECRAKRSGGNVLDCNRICDDRVKTALENYKEVVCDD